MTLRFSPKLLAILAASVLVLAACGSDDSSTKSTGSTGSSSGERAVKVEMRDNAFAPTTVSAKAGETVRFEFTNAGKVDHEAILGDEKMQDDHEEEMKNGGGGDDMAHGGEHGSMTKTEAITVKPGKTGELTHTFKAGENLLIGCHEPGHYGAGMKMTVSAA